MRVAIRTDSSLQIGTGHLMRCLTLADELFRRGHDVAFVCRELEGNVSSLVEERGFLRITLPQTSPSDRSTSLDEDGPPHAAWLGTTQDLDARQTRDALSDVGELDWLIVDHYGIDARWEKVMRERCERVMVIDDLADRSHDCDLLLDQNLYPDKDRRYVGIVPRNCLTLLGPKFALLRPEFARLSKERRARTGVVRRILIFFGGVDAENETIKSLEAVSLIGDPELAVDVVIGASNPNQEMLRRYCKDRPEIRLHVQTARIAQLMRKADLAIGAGGVVTWERCAMGLPAIAWSVAENQYAVVDAVAEHGAVYAPDAGAHANAAALSIYIRAFIDSRPLRSHLERCAAALCDGNGARRVADLLAPLGIVLREAMSSDCDKVYQWRNNHEIRGSSISADTIPYRAHRTWFESCLLDANKALLIAELDGTPHGVLRYDFVDEVAIVSLYAVPGTAKQGIGSAILSEGEKWLRSNRPGVERIRAVILEANNSSKALFEKCGFVKQQLVFEKVSK